MPHRIGLVNPMSDAQKKYHYVIIGAGVAGGVLAKRLAADPDVTGLLIDGAELHGGHGLRE